MPTKLANKLPKFSMDDLETVYNLTLGFAIGYLFVVLIFKAVEAYMQFDYLRTRLRTVAVMEEINATFCSDFQVRSHSSGGSGASGSSNDSSDARPPQGV